MREICTTRVGARMIAKCCERKKMRATNEREKNKSQCEEDNNVREERCEHRSKVQQKREKGEDEN